MKVFMESILLFISTSFATLDKAVTLGVVHCDSQTLGGLQCEHLIINPITTHNRVIRS